MGHKQISSRQSMALNLRGRFTRSVNKPIIAHNNTSQAYVQCLLIMLKPGGFFWRLYQQLLVASLGSLCINRTN